MELEYKINLDNIIEFNIFHLKQSKTLKKMLTGIKILFPIVLALIFFIIFLKFYTPVFTIILSIIYIFTVIFWILFFEKYYYFKISKKIRKIYMEAENKSIIGRQKIILKNKTLIEITETSKTEYKDKFLVKIEQNNNFYFLYINSNQALIIPKKIFINQKHEDEFNSIIQNYL